MDGFSYNFFGHKPFVGVQFCCLMDDGTDLDPIEPAPRGSSGRSPLFQMEFAESDVEHFARRRRDGPRARHLAVVITVISGRQSITGKIRKKKESTSCG